MSNNSKPGIHERIVYVIGSNKQNELGINKHPVNKLTRSNISNLTQTISHITCGRQYTIYTDNKHQNYWSVGDNKYGQCSVGDKSHKRAIPITLIDAFDINNTKIRKVCANITGYCTFWITTQGHLYGNGCSEDDALGLQQHNEENEYSPVLIDELEGVQDVQCSNLCSIALLFSTSHPDIIIKYWYKDIPSDIVTIIINFYSIKNLVYSTGKSMSGGHGHGTEDKFTWTPIQSLYNKHIIKLQVGVRHSLFLESNGTLWGIGSNHRGQIGMGSATEQQKAYYEATAIHFHHHSLMKVKIIDCCCGMHHSLATDDNGGIYSFGANKYGQCGNGSNKHVYFPTIIEKLRNYTMIELGCGAVNSYAKSDDDNHYLWGDNSCYQCIKYNDDILNTNVNIPYCINEPVAKETEGKNIYKVFLGYDSTQIIVY